MSQLIDLASKLLDEDFNNLPVIDLTYAASPDRAQREAVAAEIRSACLNAGFFFVKNHSVPRQVVDNAFAAAAAFFAQSPGVKESVDISKSDNFRGYMKLLSENNDPTKQGEMHESWNIGLDPSIDTSKSTSDFAPQDQPRKEGSLVHSDNLWPETSTWSGAEDFKRANLEYYSAILALGQSLFPLFALALDLPETFFDDKTRHPAAIMRMLKYPGIPPDQVKDENPGIGAHTDFECFTILAQGGPGLQVQNRSGEWIDAPVIPDTFVINIGDQFARWTNDIFVSTPHRVLPPRETRYSIPFFFGCDHDVPLIPPSTCVSDARPNKYQVMTAGAYVHKRLSETYAASQKKP
ncbi:hypothetical protein DB88DRAFT_193700 [Papiliotrema laurentii]|uniref:Fe2OG dioxygenase domain-containing protein n=1 Tax=Papiliotrema laurentii TaxID=5418 RepID=A0AAD9FSU5_PAPLA|nr:hypothetical protein DB88DRAFT_193700 [Papiliotrema laurentii]